MKDLTQGKPSDKMVNVRRGTEKPNSAKAARQKERYIMAEKKNTITEVAALNAAIAASGDKLAPEVKEKLEHMVEVRSRKYDRKKDDSKRLANIALGEKFVETWEGDTFKAADVAAVLGVSPAKASAVCKAMGWNTIPTTEKVNVYSL